MAQKQDTGKHDRGGLKGALNAAGDMVDGLLGQASASAGGSHSSEAFVMNASVSDLYEIQAGRIAVERARSDAVREFGMMMIEHHTTAKHQMQAALMSSEVTRLLPGLKPTTQLDDRHNGMLQHLREASAENFDAAYLDQQRLAHQEAVTLHEGYVENGDNPQLQSVAVGGLPMVERHLKAIDRIGVH
jgi:putative membrane protein